MQFDGALIREQGQTFAVVIVKKHILESRGEAEKAVMGLGSVFPGIPVVLMAQDSRGRPTYYGRQDIARFLSGVSPQRIPWKKYSIN